MDTTTSTPATKTPDEIAATERARNLELVASFRAEYAGRILRVAEESRSVWLDGGEYYAVLVATVWVGGEGPGAEKRITVCTNADSAFVYRPVGLPALVADVSDETEAAWQAWHAVEEAYRTRVMREANRRSVESGDLVVVARGVKVPQGLVGVCTGVFAGSFGQRVRISPVREDGSTPTGRDEVEYTAPGNLDILMDTDDVRDDWRSPVRPIVLARLPVAELAWRWAARDASQATDEELGAREGYHGGLFRAALRRELFAAYADRLVALDADLIEAVRLADTEPVLVEAGRAHTLPVVLDALTGDETWRRTFRDFDASATRPAKGRAKPVNLRQEAVLAAVRGGVGEVYEAPKAPRVKRAGKGTTSAPAACANDDGGEPDVGAVA